MIPGSTMGIFLEGEDSCADHGLGRLEGFRFKAPPGTTSSSITTHTPSGNITAPHGRPIENSMASVEAVVNTCSRHFEQSFCFSDEDLCKSC